MALTETERFPGLAPALRTHPLMNSRKVGSCGTMTGSIYLAFLFVDTPDHPWTSKDKKSSTEVHGQALKRLLRDARKRNVPLTIHTQYMNSRVDSGVTMSDHGPWVEKVLKNAGLPPLKEVHSYLTKKAGTDSATLCFCVNGLGRSFACTGIEEYIILFEPDALFHEFCHLYGASDFYFPEQLAKLAKKYYPHSIMLGSSTEDPEVDGLTAYLISWTDILSKHEQNFLKELEKIPLEHFKEGRETEHFTGDAVNLRTRRGVYTGKMVDGIPQGYGKYVYHDGASYEGVFEAGYYHGQGQRTDTDKNRSIGTFVKGQLEGEGTILYADGGRFQGMFSKGVREGFGTMMWPSGDRYSGNYNQGKRTGYGTYTFPDGSRYEGEFLDGKYHGRGEDYYADGAVYKGEYVMGKRTGHGILTHPDGFSYTGQFLDGKFHGRGTTVWPDGNSYTGQFQNGLRHGHGTYRYPDGSTYVGQYREGKKYGKGVYTFSDGSKNSGTWDNDKFLG